MNKVIIEKIEDLETKTRNLDMDKSDECCNFTNFLNLLPSKILPMTIFSSERPDFIIEINDHKTGIELTLSCHAGWEESSAYLGSSKDKKFHKIARNWFNGIRFRGKKLGEYLANKQRDSSVWHPNDMATEWCN